MNYYGPRKLKDGGWHYTQKQGSGSRARVWPLGYCSGLPVTTRGEYEEKFGDNAPDDWDADRKRVKDAKRSLKVKREQVDEHEDKFHEHGHDTKEDAIDCYTEYCLDFRCAIWSDEPTDLLRYMGIQVRRLSEPVEGDDVPPDTRAVECPYEDCSTLVANVTAMVGGPGLPDELHLCSEHCTHECIEDTWRAPEESFGSF